MKKVFKNISLITLIISLASSIANWGNDLTKNPVVVSIALFLSAILYCIFDFEDDSANVNILVNPKKTKIKKDKEKKIANEVLSDLENQLIGAKDKLSSLYDRIEGKDMRTFLCGKIGGIAIVIEYIRDVKNKYEMDDAEGGTEKK